MSAGSVALWIRLAFGVLTTTAIVASVPGISISTLLLVMPLMSIPVLIYICLFRTIAWSLGVGVALFATWMVMRLPLSDDGLHGVGWFTLVPCVLVILRLIEQSQLRRSHDRT